MCHGSVAGSPGSGGHSCGTKMAKSDAMMAAYTPALCAMSSMSALMLSASKSRAHFLGPLCTLGLGSSVAGAAPPEPARLYSSSTTRSSASESVAGPRGRVRDAFGAECARE